MDDDAGSEARELEARERVAFVGKTGSGKSYGAQRLVRALKNPRVLVFDPHDEWSRNALRGDGPCASRVTVDELAERPEVLGARRLSLAVVPGQRGMERAEDFGFVAEMVESYGDLVFVVDEVGSFGVHAQEALEAVACEFRKFGVPWVVCAQRAIHIPKDARTQLSEVWSGRQDEPSDVAALAARCGEDFAERARRLPPRTLIQWRDTWDEGEST